ncbi:MAG: transposase [Thiotrichaceae bacterium IS1]|nr:MAG: transposase [Thiotrichaceae bacterium IS1]
MSDYLRYRVPGGCYFFTVNLLERKKHLLTEHIDLLRHAFRTVKQQRPFHIDAIIILPEHLHCIWTLPENDADFSGRWRAIKKIFSKQLPTTEYRSEVRLNRHERGIWQRRFWEHTIRDEMDYIKHIDYIHYNPVKHGWVTHVIDWPYSSFHRFVKQGICSPTWGTTVDLSYDFDK